MASVLDSSMALSVRADLERISRLASAVRWFVDVLEPRTVTIWIDTLPFALREEPSFKALVADLEGLRRHRAKLEQMVERLQRQMHHLREYLASVEYSYQYAYRANAVALPPVEYLTVCPQRYAVAAGEYAVPTRYAARSRACAVPDPGALERILNSWHQGATGDTYGGSHGLDDRVIAPDGAVTGRQGGYDASARDPERYSR